MDIFPTTMPLLSLLIWLPIVGGALALGLGHRPSAMRWFSLFIAVVGVVLGVELWQGFQIGGAAMQFRELHAWIPTYAINYALGVDGISIALIVLTKIVTVLVIGGAWKSVTTRAHQYMASILILDGVMTGVFCAMDAMLFYVFFEAMLIPMFIIIGVWGGPRRVYASLKFFLYTFLGSIFMLLGLIYLYIKCGSFDLAVLRNVQLTLGEQSWLFFAFLVSFAVKVPMVPVHTWLPDAHVEAPTGGSVILAAIMLKIGGYGFLRFSLPITPDASDHWAWLIVALSLIAIIYIGLVAIVQDDMKKLIAYSSVAHMGFVTLGIFIGPALVRAFAHPAAAQLGMQGAMVQMISHGFISGALFSCVGVLSDRLHTRKIADYGGVINVMPWFGGFFVFFAMANCGLPGTSGFVGEFMVILASFQRSPLIALGAAVTLILAAAFSLWLVKRIVFGAVGNDRVRTMSDIDLREALVLGAFAIGVLIVGIYPKPLTDLMAPAVAQLNVDMAASKLPH